LIHSHIFNLSGLTATDTEQTEDYNHYINEFSFVGSGRGGFGTTDKLHVMKYPQAIVSTEQTQWIKTVQEEYEQMESKRVFEVIPKTEVPP
jgi:hypothetical protein